MSDTSSFRDKVNNSKQSSERIPKFVSIIFQMIEDSHYQEYVGWSQDGCAMLIKKPTEFAETVLPVFFKHNNFSSFVRQLNLYSFRKKKHYPVDNAFVHVMFRRGQKGLLQYIRRKGSDKYPNFPQDASPSHYMGEREEDVEYEELLRQNTYLKKAHEDLTVHVQNVEQKASELSKDNEKLQSSYTKTKSEEELLRKIVKQLSKIHGEDSIKDVVRSILQQDQGLMNEHIQANKPYAIKTEYSDAPLNQSKVDLAVSNLSNNQQRNISNVSESYMLSDVREDQKLLLFNNDFEAKYETEKSTPSSEKGALNEMLEEGGLNPKRMSTNFSNWSFHNLNGEKTFGQIAENYKNFEMFFDGTFNF